MAVQVVDTVDSMAILADSLSNLQVSPPSIYIDLEGINLGRKGSTSIVTVYVWPTDQVYLVDIHTLGAAAFSTEGNTSKQSFQTILESEAFPKVFFDVRNDSDALYSEFGVRLAAIHDVQLMELATRQGSKEYLNGLTACICSHAGLGKQQQLEWTTGKSAGKEIFATFNDRPLSRVQIDYCAQDVALLPKLWMVYNAMLTSDWRTKVAQETVNRLLESQSAEYDPSGPDKTWGPWAWAMPELDYDDQFVITFKPCNRPKILPYTTPVPSDQW